MKKFLCCVLAALLALSFASGVFAADYWDEHDGTEGDPYVIDSNADLIAMRDRVNAGTEAADKYYRLTENLTLSSETGWTRIGNNDRPFKGHFDGNNKAIQVNILTRGGLQGLFGTISSTEGTYAIKSLTVNGTVTGEYIGGIVQRLNSGNIENCSFSGTVETAYSGGSLRGGESGGIVCYMTGGAVKNSSFNGNIKTTLNAEHNDGGIVGRMTGGSIENCNASGTIDIPSRSETSYIGGIAGYAQIANFSAIKDCTFSGTIKSGRVAGGIAGYVSGGNVQNNHVTAVSSSNSSITGTYLAGGIAGRIGDNVTLESCDVVSGTTVTATTEAAGGIVGLLNDSSTIKNNLSHALILGDVANKGGIIGKIEASSFTSENNKYSSAEYGIGYDGSGNKSNNPGCIKIGSDISITTSTLTDATVGEFYSVTLKTDASEYETVTWSLAPDSTLPTELTLDRTSGIISGYPAKEETSTFTVIANAGAGSASKELTLKINRAGSNNTNNNGTQNQTNQNEQNNNTNNNQNDSGGNTLGGSKDSGGGGCNAGFGLFSLAALSAFVNKKKIKA